MKLYPNTQWFLGIADDPADWLAGLRHIKNLPEIAPFLVSVRQLSADMAALALHAPRLDPTMDPADIFQPLTTTADKGKQAERRDEEDPAKASADEESPAEQANEVSSVAERPVEPVAGQSGQSQKDAPLVEQGLASNMPEVSLFDRVYCLATNIRPLVRQMCPCQSRLHSAEQRSIRYPLPEVQKEQTWVLDLRPKAYYEAGRFCSH